MDREDEVGVLGGGSIQSCRQKCRCREHSGFGGEVERHESPNAAIHGGLMGIAVGQMLLALGGCVAGYFHGCYGINPGFLYREAS